MKGETTQEMSEKSDGMSGEIAKCIHQWSAQGQGLFEQVSGYIQEVYGSCPEEQSKLKCHWTYLSHSI